MSVVEVDVEILEAFLDGGLSEAQAEAVRQRLASDPTFSHALNELIAERDTRDRFYATLQRHDSAEDQVVGRLLGGVERALDQHERREMARSDRRRMARYISAAAACVLFSFSAGWIGHRHSSDRAPFGGAFGGALLSDQQAAAPSGTGIGTLVSNVRPSGVDVTLTDSLGRILGVQHFDSLDEARNFARDVRRSLQQPQEVPQTDTVLYKAQL
jgi:hypothetical protein